MVFLSGAGGGIGIGGFVDDDEGSPPVSSFLVFFSSCFHWLLRSWPLRWRRRTFMLLWFQTSPLYRWFVCSVLKLWRRQLGRGTFRWWFRLLFAFLNIFWKLRRISLRLWPLLGLNLLSFFIDCRSQVLNHCVNHLRLVRSSLLLSAPVFRRMLILARLQILRSVGGSARNAAQSR